MKLLISNLAWNFNENKKFLALFKKNKIENLEFAPSLLFQNNFKNKNLINTKKFWNNKGVRLYSMQSILYGINNCFIFGDNKQYVPCFNPEILEESNIMVTIEEGCLTYPGLFVKIRRPDRISVKFEDEIGEEHTDELEGLMCRVFQHELDHMDGIDFTSRAGKLALDIAKRKRNKGIRKLKKMHDSKSIN